MNHQARNQRGKADIVQPTNVQRVFVEKSKTFCYKSALAQAAIDVAGEKLRSEVRRTDRIFLLVRIIQQVNDAVACTRGSLGSLTMPTRRASAHRISQKPPPPFSPSFASPASPAPAHRSA